MKNYNLMIAVFSATILTKTVEVLRESYGQRILYPTKPTPK